MRQSCQWVNTSCGSPLPPGKKYVAVQLLTKETLYCTVETKSRVQLVFDQVSSYLGLKDAELFGLALLSDGEYLFLDLNIKLSKLTSKTWKSQNNHGLDSIGRTLLSLHLRIQYYVDCPLLVRDKQTRHHYFLQLKSSFLRHCQACSEERCFLLAACALQAEVGNYNDDRHHNKHYFEPTDYFPSWILERLGEDYVVQNVPSIHKDYVGYSKGEAEMAFIKEASVPDAPHNLHVYKLKKKKNDLLGSVWLAVCSKGIEIYENGGTSSPTWKLVSTFLWADIGKLYFEKKKFEIRAVTYSDTRKFTYFTGNDDKSKHLLYLCRATHQFNLAIQPRVQELKRLESEEKKNYRELYIYSDTSDLEWEQEHGPLVMSLHDFNTLSKKGKVPNDQRTSVISNASSATTSGIVSDRVHSLDGSEDEMELSREPLESPQPPSEQLLKVAAEHELQSDVSKLPSPGPLRNALSVDDFLLPSPLVSTSPCLHDECGHSSSSERSTSTVRSCFSLVKSETVAAAAVAPKMMTVSHHSASTSDTFSSFDHSYTSSIDSSTTNAASGADQNSPKSAPRPPQRSSEHFLKPTTSPSGFATVPNCSLNDNSKLSMRFETISPLVPRVVQQPFASNGAHSWSSKCRFSQEGAGVPMGLGSSIYNARMSSTNVRPVGLQGNLYFAQHPVSHCRTRIGVSSLCRTNGNLSSPGQRLPLSKFAAIPRRLSSNADFVPTWLHSTNSNLLTYGKSVSVPNVIGENECLPPCAVATFPPPATSAYRNGYFCEEALPLYPHVPISVATAKTSRTYHWSVPNSYVKERDLLACYPDLPIPPPREFACIPPPPPYRNPLRTTHNNSSSNNNNTLTSVISDFIPPPVGFNQDGVATIRTQIPLQRTLLPIKARSEDNILLQGGSSSVCSLLHPNRNHLEGKECSMSAVSPPCYGSKVPVDNLAARKVPLSIRVQRSASSVTSNVQSREELLDFQKLRERSRHLEVPLITALCNDRTLMALPESCDHQHSATVDSRRLSYCPPPSAKVASVPSVGRPLSWHVDSGFGSCGGELVGMVRVPCTMNNNYLQASALVPPALGSSTTGKFTSQTFNSPVLSEIVHGQSTNVPVASTMSFVTNARKSAGPLQHFGRYAVPSYRGITLDTSENGSSSRMTSLQ